MSGDEVTPLEPAAELPAPLAKKLPQRLHTQARAILEMSSADRAKLFNSFGRQPPVGMVVQQTMIEANMWQGPLPQPEHLERFNAVVPGAAERIIAMAERQQAHRITLEDHAVKEQLTQSGRGQIFGLIIGVGGIALAAYLGHLGFHTAAGSVGGITLSGLAIAFIVGRSNQGNRPPAKPKPDKGSAQ